ncbi:hypothetical protein MFRU_013g01270 [Monilinia fructicola]|nr:hypothetical protein MFRU_013g01270 [Monilinia fructicola]
MSSRHNTPQDRNKKTLPSRRTGCITCNEGYMDFIPAPYDPRDLREKFRRRPFGAPKKVPYQMLDALNHEDIASLPPAVVPGQEPHPSPTKPPAKNLERGLGGKGGDNVPDEAEGWEMTFLTNFFRCGLAAVLHWFILLLFLFMKGGEWLFDMVSSGPFLPVLTGSSIFWWLTSPGAETFWLESLVAAYLLTVILATGVKYALGR